MLKWLTGLSAKQLFGNSNFPTLSIIFYPNVYIEQVSYIFQLISLSDVFPDDDVFEDFAKTYIKENYSKCGKTIDKYVLIDFKQLESWNPELANDILAEPDIYLGYLKKALKAVVESDVIISINNISTETKLRDVGANYMRKLIFLKGIVCRMVPVRPLIVSAAFECKKSICKEITYVPQHESYIVSPNICGHCRKSTKFSFMESLSKFVDIQELTIQERPEDLPAGQLPRQVKLEITRDDLIDVARAGDLVEVVGILRTRATSSAIKQRIFSMYLDVNYIETLNKDVSEMVITPDEEQEITNLAMDPNIHDLIINSIAPSIYGNHTIKEGIAYLLFGGVKKEMIDITTRGEMNILLIGDPATAKSQLLWATAGISPRAVFASGRGASAAGLTASVVKIDDVWTLEAGAMVLADKGLCCIDEMDKMRPEDVVAMHEAMEQHRISICKAGINATLNARVAVLAAANPNFGRYNKTKTISENMNKLSIPLLSRFDLIFIVKDKLEPDEDEKLSSHILGLSGKKNPIINHNLLKKYIAYARNLQPKVSESANRFIQKYYLELRSASGNAQESPVTVTPRQLESLVRITEAHAKMSLKIEADIDDAKAAIDITRKSMKEVGINPEDKKYDIDVIMTGIPKTKRDKMALVLDLLTEMDTATKEDLEVQLKNRGLSSTEIYSVINSLLESGTIYEVKSGVYKKT